MKERHGQKVEDELFALRDRLGRDVDVYIGLERRRTVAGWDDDFVTVCIVTPNGTDVELANANAREEDRADRYYQLYPQGVIGAVAEAHRKLDKAEREARQGALIDALEAGVA